MGDGILAIKSNLLYNRGLFDRGGHGHCSGVEIGVGIGHIHWSGVKLRVGIGRSYSLEWTEE